MDTFLPVMQVGSRADSGQSHRITVTAGSTEPTHLPQVSRVGNRAISSQFVRTSAETLPRGLSPLCQTVSMLIEEIRAQFHTPLPPRSC